MAFSGEILNLSSGRHADKLSVLAPLLEALPWDRAKLQLGKTMEELGNPEQIMMSTCGFTTTVEWQGKTLTVASDQGGPGDGISLSEKWYAFDRAAQPYYVKFGI